MNNTLGASRFLKPAGILGFALVSLFALWNLDSLIWHRDHAFVTAAREGSINRMRLLRLVGANAASDTSCCGPAIVHAAAEGQNGAIEYLLRHGASVTQKDKFRWTPLVDAANEGKLETVRLLLKHGADINTVGEDGSALHRAIEKHHSEVADFLRSHGGLDCPTDVRPCR